MMRTFLKYACAAAMLLVPGAFLETCWAQKWELGVLAGGGFYSNATVTSPAGTGDVGFKSGPVFGGYVGSNLYRFLGGELRYEMRPADLKLKSGGTEVTFAGQAHAMHYDFLIHATPTGSRLRPYVSAGGGVKIYRGTGRETATQPLSRLALLTKTHEVKGLGSVGVGVKVQASRAFLFRIEVRDFITPFPRQVIAPAPGAKISGLLHDVVFMGGIAATF
ncbi:MAG: hypothetical protein ABIZ80_04055 [Bryobacteraceae bacterium]